MGSPRNFRLLLKQYKWRAILFALLLVVVGGAVYAHSVAVANHNKQLQRDQIVADNRQFASLTNISNSLSAENQFSQAVNLWTTYASQTPSRVHRGLAYVDAANIYITEYKYSQAYDLCKKAEAADGITYYEAGAAGVAAQGMGNKSSAIYYYREAIKLIPSSLSDPDTQKSIYSQAIQSLGGKP